uniref:Uncharacterized protein n=1 Tax=Oryza nivara TaxID=4536 RepID=A0A0E0ITW4_ORYNI
MATICENIPNPQPNAAGAKRNRGLGTQDRCPERWRTLEKRNRNGPAHWPCGTAVVCGTNRAKFGPAYWTCGTDTVPHIQPAGRATVPRHPSPPPKVP